MSTAEVGSSYTLWKEQPVQKEQTMSDNLRRYRAIRDALTQGYPGQPTGTVARHLTTLAALISGIVGSKSTQLPSVATKIPDGTKPESRVKRLTRWLDNERILEEMYFLPYAEILLTSCKNFEICRIGSVVTIIYGLQLCFSTFLLSGGYASACPHLASCSSRAPLRSPF